MERNDVLGGKTGNSGIVKEGMGKWGHNLEGEACSAESKENVGPISRQWPYLGKEKEAKNTSGKVMTNGRGNYWNKNLQKSRTPSGGKAVEAQKKVGRKENSTPATGAEGGLTLVPRTTGVKIKKGVQRVANLASFRP